MSRLPMDKKIVPGNAAYQLPLRLTNLIVKPPQNGTAVVLLDKRIGQSGRQLPNLRIETIEEKPFFIGISLKTIRIWVDSPAPVSWIRVDIPAQWPGAFAPLQPGP